jgi:hypothetical protein
LAQQVFKPKFHPFFAPAKNLDVTFTTSRRASTGFLAGKKYLFFASDGTFERSVSMINH